MPKVVRLWENSEGQGEPVGVKKVGGLGVGKRNNIYVLWGG